MNTLLKEQASFVQKAVHCFGALMEVESGCPGPRHENHVDIVRQTRAVSAIDFSQIALNAIAYDGLAHLARYSETELPALLLSPNGKADKLRPYPLPAMLEDGRIFPATCEPLPLRKCACSGHKTRFLPIRQKGVCAP